MSFAPEIKVLPDAGAVAQAAAERIVASCRDAIGQRGTFSIALAGGSTPKALYELLASESYRGQIDWPMVEIFFGDERCVPPDHLESNFRMAERALLSHVPIPGDNIYRMAGEIDPNEGAKEYGQMLKDKFGNGGPDLILLGMGDDGHTASLFPDTEALAETHHRCVANYVPKLRAWRLTLTAPFINRAGEVLTLVAGKSKSKRIQEVLESSPDQPARLPIEMIKPASGS